jgi:hypothetical protein
MDLDCRIIYLISNYLNLHQLIILSILYLKTFLSLKNLRGLRVFAVKLLDTRKQR